MRKLLLSLILLTPNVSFGEDDSDFDVPLIPNESSCLTCSWEETKEFSVRYRTRIDIPDLSLYPTDYVKDSE